MRTQKPRRMIFVVLLTLCLQSESLFINNHPVCVGRMQCPSSFQCLEYDKVCDGVEDCPFGKDELFCQCISDDDCIEGAQCVRDDLKKKCKKNCRKGFKDIVGRCLDLDECRENFADCDANEQCVNTIGSYRCDCKYGFHRPEPNGKCVDINECEGDHQLCESPLCVNTIGSFECTCPPHYEPTSSYKNYRFIHSCSMKNYCHNVTCPDPQRCRTDLLKPNLTTCECPPGYNGIGDSHCEDIDECASTDLNICDRIVSKVDNSYTCENRKGTYSCRCKQQFFRSIWLDKILVTICPHTQIHCKASDQCPEHSKCKETMCICDKGFKSKNRKCEDIDECAINSYNCPPHLACVNTKPGYMCTCPPGYRAALTESENVTLTCVDIDECTENTHECEHGCTNTVGGYKCSCLQNFFPVNNICYPWSLPSSILILDDDDKLIVADFSFDTNTLQKRDIHPFGHSCNTRHPAEFMYNQKAKTFYHVSTDRTCIYSNNETICQALVYDTDIAHLTVDNEFGNIYWIGANNTLHVSDAEATHKRVIATFSSNITSLVVNSHHGWLLAISKAVVYRVDLDGKNLVKIRSNDTKIERVFLDADFSPVILMNGSLHSCADFKDSFFEDCRQLDIPIQNNTIIDVYMDFVFFIDQDKQLQIANKFGKQKFHFNGSDINPDSHFILIQPYQNQHYQNSCIYCNDLCLNSPSQPGHCVCGDRPCSLTLQWLVNTTSYSWWYIVSGGVIILVGIPGILIGKRVFIRSRSSATERVGFYSENNEVRVSGNFSESPCVNIPHNAQLLDD